MATFYIRDVSPSATNVLKRRAAESGLSLSAYVARQLERLAARPSNEEIAARLIARDRSNGPGAAAIVEALREERP